ncbi:hypothetical protein [Comamonas brasiliensis]|uniref:hypothetical protein n=1 Tax=Comamonas brasiliensis TaxID=1812482 RepID=UPI001B8ACBC5|nr:hypothetical protein [Comamonas sp. PE63]
MQTVLMNGLLGCRSLALRASLGFACRFCGLPAPYNAVIGLYFFFFSVFSSRSQQVAQGLAAPRRFFTKASVSTAACGTGFLA